MGEAQWNCVFTLLRFELKYWHQSVAHAVTHSQSQATRVQWVYSEAENSAATAIAKRLGDYETAYFVADVIYCRRRQYNYVRRRSMPQQTII